MTTPSDQINALLSLRNSLDPAMPGYGNLVQEITAQMDKLVAAETELKLQGRPYDANIIPG